MKKKQPKLTPWLPEDMKPVRVGMYQRYYAAPSSRNAPDYWDGEQWILCDVYGRKVGVASQQERLWRGLAKQPKAVKP